MIWFAVLSAGLGAGWLLGHGELERNLQVVTTWGPRGALVALQGITLGLCGRDRVRLRRAYSSPTLAFLGKRLLLGSLVVVATYAFSPVAWPAEWLDAIAAANAIGWAVWLANLPTRL